MKIEFFFGYIPDFAFCFAHSNAHLTCIRRFEHFPVSIPLFLLNKFRESVRTIRGFLVSTSARAAALKFKTYIVRIANG